jgi:hypothetical protein
MSDRGQFMAGAVALDALVIVAEALSLCSGVPE